MTQPQTRRRVLAALGTAATAGLAGCASVFATSEYDVGMRTQAFAPKTLQVDPGTTVVWRNTSTRGHTVTAYEDTLPDGVDFFASGGYESEAAARDRDVRHGAHPPRRPRAERLDVHRDGRRLDAR